jgi:hypothetical protein
VKSVRTSLSAVPAEACGAQLNPSVIGWPERFLRKSRPPVEQFFALFSCHKNVIPACDDAAQVNL